MNMKRKSFSVIAAAALIGGFVLMGTAQAAEKANKPDPLQMARGAQAWAQQCARCHNLRDPKELTDDIWEVSITHMQVRANIPGNVIRDIKAFLKASN